MEDVNILTRELQIASDISLPTLAAQHTPCRERKTEAELRGLRSLTAIGPISLFPFPLGFQREEERETLVSTDVNVSSLVQFRSRVPFFTR